MLIRISDVINDSIVDGPGIRLTVFTQGCPHHCEGCHNPQTHAVDGGKLWDTEKIIRAMAENPLLDGLTLSGGEPFLQAEACRVLASAARDLGLNVWIYSGFTWEELTSGPEDWKGLLAQTDILIDGPFQLESRSLELRFRGSKNQRVIDVPKSIAENRLVLSELYS